MAAENGDTVALVAGDGDTSKDMKDEVPELVAEDPKNAFYDAIMRANYIANLPTEVKRRVKALKKLQFEWAKVEAKFYQEVHVLEAKYATQFQPIYEKRRNVVKGELEPTDSDCDWPSDEEDDGSDSGENKEALAKELSNLKSAKVDAGPGVPTFWLTVLKNVSMLAEMIQPHDEEILKSLEDVQIKYITEAASQGFILEFYFAPNEYFTDTILTKTYIFDDEVERDNLDYEGPDIKSCNGCTITWNKGKNVTVKVVKKKQKGRGGGNQQRTITKTVQAESFFNFFTPPVVKDEDEEDEDEDKLALLDADFEIGAYLRDRVVPRAVLIFTGELNDDEDGYPESDSGEEYDEDDDDEEGSPAPHGKAGKNTKGGTEAQPQECKQQ